MANNVVEEKQKKAGFCRRLCSGVYHALKGPSITHSVLFGICGGLFYYGAYYGYRYMKISFFDTMHVSNESRRRFMEKQMLFYNDMGYNLSMKYIGKGVPTQGEGGPTQNGNTPKKHQHMGSPTLTTAQM